MDDDDFVAGVGVGEPASASASSSVIVVPVIVILPGARTSPLTQTTGALELIDLDPHLRVPEEAGREHRA